MLVNYSAPVVYDWNSDGTKDLLVGQEQALQPVIMDMLVFTKIPAQMLLPHLAGYH